MHPAANYAMENLNGFHINREGELYNTDQSSQVKDP